MNTLISQHSLPFCRPLVTWSKPNICQISEWLSKFRLLPLNITNWPGAWYRNMAFQHFPTFKPEKWGESSISLSQHIFQIESFDYQSARIFNYDLLVLLSSRSTIKQNKSFNTRGISSSPRLCNWIARLLCWRETNKTDFKKDQNSTVMIDIGVFSLFQLRFLVIFVDLEILVHRSLVDKDPFLLRERNRNRNRIEDWDRTWVEHQNESMGSLRSLKKSKCCKLRLGAPYFDSKR